jgi:glycosyltransferase involved in cell wall biosynthesis
MREPAVKRILMTADTMGGVWGYALDLIQALAPGGVQVALATMGASPTPAQREELREVRNAILFESRHKLEWMDDPWKDVAAAGRWLLEIERDFAPDVVHLNGYAHGALPWQAPVLVVGHSCVLSWWRAVKQEEAPARWAEYRAAVSAGLKGAQAVAAPSYAMLKELVEFYGVPGITRVIPNGRGGDAFRPAMKEDFILSAGRLWDEAKNVGAVCACASRLPWPVCIAGETEHPGGESSEFAAVRRLGKLPKPAMAEWLARAAIFAHPAKYEPFGLSVLEAGLSGCALVLGDIESLRENWEGAAVFVDPFDERALGSALHGLIEHPEQRRSLGRRARQRALEFSMERTARQHLHVYAELAAGRARRGEAQEVLTA